MPLAFLKCWHELDFVVLFWSGVNFSHVLFNVQLNSALRFLTVSYPLSISLNRGNTFVTGVKYLLWVYHLLMRL